MAAPASVNSPSLGDDCAAMVGTDDRREVLLPRDLGERMIILFRDGVCSLANILGNILFSLYIGTVNRFC